MTRVSSVSFPLHEQEFNDCLNVCSQQLLSLEKPGRKQELANLIGTVSYTAINQQIVKGWTLLPSPSHGPMFVITTARLPDDVHPVSNTLLQ